MPKNNGFDEMSVTVTRVIVAAFTLSVRTNLKVQESQQLIKQVIVSKRIAIEQITRVIACLHNIGVCLNQTNQQKMIECIRSSDGNERTRSRNLHALLQSSVELSKGNIAMILEQELTAYEKGTNSGEKGKGNRG